MFVLGIITALSMFCVSLCQGEKDYSSIPLDYNKEDLLEYRKRTKVALAQNAAIVLKRNTDDENWCDVLDAVVMDVALEISKKHHSTLDEILRARKDHLDVYFSVAAQIPTFNDIMTQGPCSTMTRGSHGTILKGLEDVAKKTFENAVLAAEREGKEPLHQFGTVSFAVKHLAKIFQKDF